MIGFLYPTSASGYYGLRYSLRSRTERLPLRIPNASSLVDFFLS